MQPLSHVRPGDPLNAGQQNRIIDRINELGRMGNAERGLALFEATADLTYASPLDATAPHCTAKRLYYNTVNRDRQGDYTKAVDTVYMSIADYDEADGEYLGTVHIEDGDRFWAVWDSQAGRWEVVMRIETGYDRCTAFAKGDITGTGTKTVDNVVATRGVSPLADPTDTTEELSVSNPHAYDVDDNGLVRIEWNEATETWDIYQATCPS